MSKSSRIRRVVVPNVSGQQPANRVIGVRLKKGEHVEWTYSNDNNGNRFASGYTIHKKN